MNLYKEGIPFWQGHWQKIKFSELGVDLDQKKLPSSIFYNAFYSKLKSQYNNFNDLEEEWRSDKKNNIKPLSYFINNGDRILSYGSGIGYMEYLLSHSNNKIIIDCFDFSNNCNFMLKKQNKIQNINLLNELNSEEINGKYDVIYLCQVMYALTIKDSIKLFKELRSLLAKNGKLIIVHHPCQNLLSIINLKSILKFHFPFLKINNSGIKNNIQFWGYSRTDYEYIDIAKESNFNFTSKLYENNQSFLCFSKS